jgi:hypothetical protein
MCIDKLKHFRNSNQILHTNLLSILTKAYTKKIVKNQSHWESFALILSFLILSLSQKNYQMCSMNRKVNRAVNSENPLFRWKFERENFLFTPQKGKLTRKKSENFSCSVVQVEGFLISWFWSVEEWQAKIKENKSEEKSGIFEWHFFEIVLDVLLKILWICGT